MISKCCHFPGDVLVGPPDEGLRAGDVGSAGAAGEGLSLPATRPAQPQRPQHQHPDVRCLFSWDRTSFCDLLAQIISGTTRRSNWLSFSVHSQLDAVYERVSNKHRDDDPSKYDYDYEDYNTFADVSQQRNQFLVRS